MLSPTGVTQENLGLTLPSKSLDLHQMKSLNDLASLSPSETP